ncbi:E3 ubiquitin-protein ligase MBR2 isoform X1 [Senna tora]|uniref:RING-type E3 ubiquitin transferase n=1 Tax=Senna tora TaxID=362788 RepID=A0A835CG12_9FABA|nr:E3 ubiquitin-protein ligase MBR2 isoform X1 [Senna tora]
MKQGPSASGTDTNQQAASLNHVQNAVDTRLSDYKGSVGETACLCITNPDVQRLNNWINTGESSSRLDLHSQVNDDGLKAEHGWSSSCNAPADGPEERQFKPDNVIFPFHPNINFHGDQSSIHQPYPCKGSSSTPNLNLNMGQIANIANRGKGTETDGGVDIHNANRLEREHPSFGSTSCDDIGTSFGSSRNMVWGDNASSSSSLVNWSSSCKRKALEDSSGLQCTGGSSSFLAESENSSRPAGPSSNASTSSSVSTPSEDAPTTSTSFQHNPGNEVWQAPSEDFPLPSVARDMERNSYHSSLHQISISNSFDDSLELRLTAGVTVANSGAPQSQSLAVHVPGLSLNAVSFPCYGAANPRGASSSTSYESRERAVRDESNLSIPPRDNTEHHMFVPAPLGQAPALWHISSLNANDSGALPLTSQMGSGASTQLFSPTWIVNSEVPMQNLQRLSEFRSLSQSDVHNGHSTSLPLPSVRAASTQDTSNPQSYVRSASLMGRRGEDVFSSPSSLRAFASDNEGRRRLISEIRQVLNAMRRGENIQAQDGLLFDPSILQVHGMAELHDRHRDMRLDVDNMSYEELLALEERIGDVNTGLSEDIIMKSMKERVYVPVMSGSSSDLEPCCICQEEYVDGEHVGSLDCGHEFHINCIKKWLMLKNLCPICKIKALGINK